jgi:hypothetical protein
MTRLRSRRRRLDPDLEKVHRLGAGGIELAVPQGGSDRHSLDFVWTQDFLVTHTVLVRERALKDMGQNFHVAMYESVLASVQYLLRHSRAQRGRQVILNPSSPPARRRAFSRFVLATKHPGQITSEPIARSRHTLPL